ncbi:MAG: hypothetical protein ACK56F_14470, partial [bacterium]
MHSRNTSDPPRRRGVCGSVKLGDPTVSDTCEVQGKGPPQMEDRKRMVLRIPRDPTLQRSWTIARAPSYKCSR